MVAHGVETKDIGSFFVVVFDVGGVWILRLLQEVVNVTFCISNGAFSFCIGNRAFAYHRHVALEVRLHEGIEFTCSSRITSFNMH